MKATVRTALVRSTLRILCVLAIAASPVAAPAVERLALVIGNGDYREAPLVNPVNDAQLMAEALEDTGFRVVHVENADRREMRAAVRAFAASTAEAGRDVVALFYYAGHGIQADGRNFLLPVGAELQAPADLPYETIEAQWVLDMIGDARAGVSIIVLDACRNNPFRSASRGATRGLAQMDAPQGSILAYSTAPGKAALDGDGASSPYTGALAKLIRQPGLKIEEVFKQVRRAVYTQTDAKQVPWESSSLIGDFYFAGAKREPPPLALLATPKPAANGRLASRSRGVGDPSFNCRKATTNVEKLICEVDPLAMADGDMGRAYKGARDGLSKAEQKRLRARQIAWIKGRDAHCAQRSTTTRSAAARDALADCLLRMTRDRVVFLDKY